MAPKKDTPAQRDECINYAMEALWQNFDQYLKDKLIFPQIISYAVARTVAGMVHMVSVGAVNRMESWDAPVENRVAEEWLVPKEPVLPPLDTWARGVVQMKKEPPPPPPPASVDVACETASEQQELRDGALSPVSSVSTAKSPSLAVKASGTARRASIAASPVEKSPPGLYDRKGSPLRRFSEGTVLPPEMVTKFKAPPREDAASVEGSVSSTRSSIRKSRMSRVSSLAEGRKSVMLNSRKPSKAGDVTPPTPRESINKAAATRRASMK